MNKIPQFIFNALIKSRFWLCRLWSRKNSFFSLKKYIKNPNPGCILFFTLTIITHINVPVWQGLRNTEILLWDTLAFLESKVFYFSIKQLQQCWTHQQSVCFYPLGRRNRKELKGVFWSCYSFWRCFLSCYRTDLSDSFQSEWPAQRISSVKITDIILKCCYLKVLSVDHNFSFSSWVKATYSPDVFLQDPHLVALVL